MAAAKYASEVEQVLLGGLGGLLLLLLLLLHLREASSWHRLSRVHLLRVGEQFERVLSRQPHLLICLHAHAHSHAWLLAHHRLELVAGHRLEAAGLRLLLLLASRERIPLVLLREVGLTHQLAKRVSARHILRLELASWVLSPKLLLLNWLTLSTTCVEAV